MPESFRGQQEEMYGAILGDIYTGQEVMADDIRITKTEEVAADAPEEPGMGPVISKHPMKGIEDIVEQNDNNLDGVINNLPESKPAV